MIKICKSVSVANKISNGSCIIQLTRDKEYVPFRTYNVKTTGGVLVHNMLGFSILYEKVSPRVEFLTPISSKIIWEHPGEKHVEQIVNKDVVENIVLPSYSEWRNKGFMNPYPVLMPSGNYQFKKVCSIDNFGQKISIRNAKIRYYLNPYKEYAKDLPIFLELKRRLLNGENIILVEYTNPNKYNTSYYINSLRKAGKHTDDVIGEEWLTINSDTIDCLMADDNYLLSSSIGLAFSLLDIQFPL